jgi:hypothetical protein
VEGEVLQELGAIDRRLAARAGLPTREADARRVAMAAVLAEDASLGLVDGALDPFSFEARARELARVKGRLGAALRAEGQGAARRAEGQEAPPLDAEVLARLVDEELARVEEERSLPRSASALVRAAVEAGAAPETPGERAEREQWLVRRLGEVREAVRRVSDEAGAREAAGFDPVRARELDDALDGLERAVESAGLTRATAELVTLRDAIEALASRPRAAARADWAGVARSLEVHLGCVEAPVVLEARLDALARGLRDRAEAAIARAAVPAGALAMSAAPMLLAAGDGGRASGEGTPGTDVAARRPCGVAVPGSRVRSMGPPPEREAACWLRRAVALASDDASRALALVAMHDHVVVAQWALDVARGTATLAQTTARHRPLSRPPLELMARWERLAVARPAAAIGGGLAAALLAEGPDPQARARAWEALGEVPLDLAARALRAATPP